MDEAGRPADYAMSRKLRSAWVASAVMLEGERQRRRYPRAGHPIHLTSPAETPDDFSRSVHHSGVAGARASLIASIKGPQTMTSGRPIGHASIAA
ncbi:hypothetical protein MOP88_03235 [Sphingomonas sp. WKB10]|nr:hypothetical protein [Sphingomonas sp. WKB10]